MRKGERPRAGSYYRAVGYFDWHAKPGSYGDVVRHFRHEDTVLDLGCGTAWLAESFQHYVGVDASPDVVDDARSEGVDVHLGDLSGTLPFPEGEFDGVIAKDVLEHLPDPKTLVQEAFRVLRPGGLVWASSPDAQRWVWDDYTHKRPFTRKAYRRLFRDQGFEIRHLSYESVLPGSGVLAGMTRSKRRPWFLRVLAWCPMVPRNVWVLARKPDR